MEDGDLEPSRMVPVAERETECFGELEIEAL
jgi:hypothetical protein